ncbi:MAG: YqgE/AlgH family protein [Nitriliruptorales bacterium]
MDEPLEPLEARGRLLVAAPDLADPNFHRTVVLLLEHDDDGTLGVVLNRPSETAVGELLPDWQRTAADPGVVFVGGPVVPNGLIGIAEATGAADEGIQLPGGLEVVDLEQTPGLSGAGRLRVFAGHAGWVGGQLEAEVMGGSWFIVDAEPGDVFSADPEELWTTVLRRQGGVFTTVPVDPSLN